MAARENQGYLIAVIILVLLSLALALVSFLGVQNAYEQAETAEASEAKLKVARLIADAEALKGEAYKAMIGLGPAPSELDSIVGDIERIADNQTLAEGDRTLVSAIVDQVRTAREVYEGDTGGAIKSQDDDATFVTLRSRITELTTLVDRMRNDVTVQRRITDEAALDAREKIKQARAELDSANTELRAVQKKSREDTAAAQNNERVLTEQIKASENVIAETTQKMTDATDKAAALLSEAKNQVAKLEQDNENLKTTLNELTNQSFDHADGQIIRVASALDRVFISIGSNDGLTNNRTFSIYDQSVTNFEAATPKGKIEVVRVDAFRSEARIIDEDPVDPILRGDFILTPVWDPGFSLKIALAGRFDLDGDRFDDTEKLIRLIEQNGGQVVARHDEKGNVTGAISPEVRFLVKGNEALIGGEEGDANAGRIVTALNEMEDAATKSSVQVIDLQKLLNRMGVSAQPKTKQLDFPAGGFVPRKPGSSQGSGSSTR